MSQELSIVTLPGDGIGVEVMAEGRKILETALKSARQAYVIEEYPCGGKYYLEHGRDHENGDWPPEAQEACTRADVIFLGAVGWPDPNGSGPVTMANGRMAGYSAVIGNRSRLDLFANVRPVKLYPGVRARIHGKHARVWEPDKVDMVFVRENTEGLYSQIGGFLETGGTRKLAIDNRVTTRTASERVIRFAFELARKRTRGAPHDGKKRLSCIVKDNVMDGCRLFRDIFYEIGREYRDVEQEHVIIDAFTQWLITKPEWYDVLVTTNMFGDIVTDLASVLQGGMGLAVGCNIGAEHAMFEPIHGSAPSRVGNQANPLAMILAIKEGLSWVAERKSLARLAAAAGKIEQAVVHIIAEGKTLTYDLVGPDAAVGTSAVGDAVNARLKMLLG